LPLDGAGDWSRRARPQVRRSNVEIITAARQTLVAEVHDRDRADPDSGAHDVDRKAPPSGARLGGAGQTRHAQQLRGIRSNSSRRSFGDGLMTRSVETWARRAR
jgi:hypothetical protein